MKDFFVSTWIIVIIAVVVIGAIVGGLFGAGVFEALPAEPTIGCSPPSFSFTATEDGANPSNQTLEIWNSGGGTLNWHVSDDVDWVSLSPLGGFSTGEQNAVTVSVNISGMTAGSYNATITISACCPNPTNSPQHVPVSLNISAGLVESANTEAACVRIAVQAYIADGGSSIAGVMGSTAGPSRNCTGFTPNTHGKTPMDYFDGELRAEYSINTTALCIITAADPSGPGNWGDTIEWDTVYCEWKEA